GASVALLEPVPAHREPTARPEQPDHGQGCLDAHLDRLESPAHDRASAHLTDVVRGERGRGELACASLAVGEAAVCARRVPCPLPRDVDQGVAHVQAESELDDGHEQDRGQACDEPAVDGCGAALAAGEPPGAAETRETAAVKIPLRAGPAKPQMSRTRPAVMRVTGTQPGTSPRSASSSSKRRAMALYALDSIQRDIVHSSRRPAAPARHSPTWSSVNPGKIAKTTVTGSTRNTTGTIIATSLRPPVSMSARRPASRTSCACERSTSASGVPRSTATATPCAKRVRGASRTRSARFSSAPVSGVPERASASVRASSTESSPCVLR